IPDDVADAGTDLPSGFPRESVVGAIDPEAVDAVLKDLAATGVAKERVQTFAGPEAEEALRNVTTGPTRALAFLFGFESEHTRRHLRELEGGHALMVVMVDDGEQAEGVGRVLARHGGHY